ncbi:MAG: phosphoribosylanthranilate isomerase [Bacteroidota bacterium]
MALKTFVKISGVNNLSDARYCAGMGVNFIGFDLDPESENYTTPEKFKEISDWISGVDFVGEFGNSSSQDVIEALSNYTLSAIETTDHGLLADVHSSQTILKVNVEELRSLPLNINSDFLLIQSNNMLSPTQIQEVRARITRTKVLLDCEVQAYTVEDLIETTGAYGISLVAGNEIRPGYKDYDELADILEALEAED